jgi:hypothetical protein
MMRQLVFVHGRSQEHKDSIALKGEWLDALKEGLTKAGLTLPIAEQDVRFPFYGDSLFDLVAGKSADAAAEIVTRGLQDDADEQRFAREVLEEVQRKTGVTDAQVAAVAGQDVVERGPQNWEWFHGVLQAIDYFVPFGSGASIALFTHDVYQYLKNPAIRQHIEAGVSQAITPGVETVMVSHSLGTVVAYNLLRGEGTARGWRVPLFITLGSPLAIGAIRKALKGLGPLRCPECAAGWFNAMDDRDVVALYPLTPSTFPLDPTMPPIENKTDISNRTQNRHGIAGYLDDAVVARRIHNALTG